MIKTGTTTVTFLMVFLIQSTQSRVTEGAWLVLLDLEEMKAIDLAQIKSEFVNLARKQKRSGTRSAATADDPNTRS